MDILFFTRCFNYDCVNHLMTYQFCYYSPFSTKRENGGQKGIKISVASFVNDPLCTKIIGDENNWSKVSYVSEEEVFVRTARSSISNHSFPFEDVGKLK